MEIIKGKTYDPFCIKRSSDENFILLNHGVYLRSEADISDMVTMDRSDLEMLLDENAQKEASVWQQIERLMDEYDFFWVRRLLLWQALRWKDTLPVNHTENKWRKGGHDDVETISNMVYRMWMRVNTSKHYDSGTGEYKVDAWYVTYRLAYNSPLNANAECIAKVDDKRFIDYEAMLKYIAGRKKAYAKYFTEISPAIPKDKAKLFSVCGTLLPGYSVKEE